MSQSFECDRDYPNGTVVCRAEDGTLHLCEHENCPFACIIAFDPQPGDGPARNIGIAGSVHARCAQDILARTMVVSDGRGGVRAVKPNEPSFVLGFTLSETQVKDHSPQVEVYLRPLFITLRSR